MEINISKKIIFVFKYVFFGFLIFSYFSMLYAFAKRGSIGVVISISALIMFYMFKDNIDPRKTSSNEFGKHTDIIGAFISIIFIFLILVPYLGDFFIF